jgi:carboxyl-terminal processing protease
MIRGFIPMLFRLLHAPLPRPLLPRWGLILLAGCLLLVNARSEIAATPEYGQVAMLVGKILSVDNYRHQPLNDDISRQFLANYLDSLDRNRLFFLASDIKDFQTRYATNLDDDTLASDIQPGIEIFNRYLKRVEQRVALVDELLKEKFTFDTDETLLKNREESVWPSNEAEARKLWRRWIKFELLQERLTQRKGEDSDKPEGRKTETPRKAEDPVKMVARRYANLLRTVRDEEDLETMMQVYLTSLTHVYDPHSEYLPPSELENFDINMKLSLCGIGAVLKSEDGYVKVVDIIPGGPASVDKRLKANDRIVGVGQGTGPMADVVGMKLSKTVSLIRGQQNTIVRLLVIPSESPNDSARVEIRLKRDKVKLHEQEARARVIEMADAQKRTHRLGYIGLPSFYADMQRERDGKSTTHDVNQLLDRLKSESIEGLLLDLRRNPGGSLAEAVNLTGLFLKEGPVVQIKDVRGRIHVMEDENSNCAYNGPLVVLVDHLSASASEILAAALQDYGRAVIVGDEKTFGKGTVQKVEDLGRFMTSSKDSANKAGALKITTQKFYRVTGGSTEGRGVLPDIHLPSVLDSSRIAETSLKNTFPYDEIAYAHYEAVDLVNPFLSRLRNASRDRLIADPEFGYINEDMKRLKAQMEEKSVSLNEAHWIKEMKTNQERQQAREKERAARKPSSVRTADITLEKIKEPLSFRVHPPSGKSAEKPKDSDDETPEVDTPSSRATLEESLRILMDLINLSSRT